MNFKKLLKLTVKRDCQEQRRKQNGCQNKPQKLPKGGEKPKLRKTNRKELTEFQGAVGRDKKYYSDICKDIRQKQPETQFKKDKKDGMEYNEIL